MCSRIQYSSDRLLILCILCIIIIFSSIQYYMEASSIAFIHHCIRVPARGGSDMVLVITYIIVRPSATRDADASIIRMNQRRRGGLLDIAERVPGRIPVPITVSSQHAAAAIICMIC